MKENLGIIASECCQFIFPHWDSKYQIDHTLLLPVSPTNLPLTYSDQKFCKTPSRVLPIVVDTRGIGPQKVISCEGEY